MYIVLVDTCITYVYSYIVGMTHATMYTMTSVLHTSGGQTIHIDMNMSNTRLLDMFEYHETV